MPEKHQQTNEQSAITKKDIRNVGLRWIFFNTSAWSFERMQNVAFAWSLLPVLKKLYKNKKDLGAALTRHMTFFNTEPTIGAPLIGAVAAMEEQKAKGEDIPDDVFNAMKSGLMGPLAALGDSLFASTGNALLLSFAMGLALQKNVLGPIMFAVIWIAVVIGFVLWGTRFGYKEGTRIVDSNILSPEMVATATKFLSILGLTVIGGLSAQFISLSTALSWAFEGQATKLQDIFDGLMPGLLPFILVFVLWYLHDKKNVSVLKLLFIIIIIGVIGTIPINGHTIF